MIKLPVAINRSVVNKQIVGWRKLSLELLSLEELAQEIKLGHSFGAQHLIEDKGNGKSSKKFLRARHLTLDFDDANPEIILEKEAIKDQFAVFYNTFSSTTTNPRFRITFLLESEIDSEKTYEQLTRAAAWKFGADLQAVDACQMFYGNDSSDPIIHEVVLTNEIWHSWIKDWLQNSYHTSTIDVSFNHLIASPIEVLINSCPFFLWCQEFPDKVNYSLWLAMVTNLIDGGTNASPYGQSSVNEIKLAFHALSQLDQLRYSEQKTNDEFDAALQRFNDDNTLGYTYRFCQENGWDGIVPSTLTRPAQITTIVSYKAPKRANPFVWAALPRRSTKNAEYAEPNFSAVMKILEYDNRQSGRYSYNLMGGKPFIDDVALTDADEVRLSEWFTDTYQITISLDYIRQGINAVAQRNRFHPVKNFLESLTWDGEDRISRIPTEILKTESSEIYAVMIRKWLISAIARVMQPGCKVDAIPILVGKQGLRKSTFFRVLASSEWFNDSDIKIGDKDAFLILGRAWITEWAELQAYKRAGRDALKAFITSQSDSFRPPYGHNEITVPRTFVIVGSTNDVNFLMDVANRRYWPILIEHKINTDLLAQWRNQIWAQAFKLYLDGENWWMPAELEEIIESHTDQFSVEEAWTEQVLSWAEDKTRFTLSEILKYALELDNSRDHNRGNLLRISEILQKAGWTPPTKPSKRDKMTGRYWENPTATAKTFVPENDAILMQKLNEVIRGKGDK